MIVVMSCGSIAEVRIAPKSGLLDIYYQYSIDGGKWHDSPCRQHDLAKWLKCVTAKHAENLEYIYK